MLSFIRVRAEAWRLTRQLRRSLRKERDQWGIDADRQGRPVLCAGQFRIALVPRALRLFDAVHLFCDEVEVWLPLIPRIRLRTAARLLIVQLAREEWENPSPEPCPTSVRTGERQPA